MAIIQNDFDSWRAKGFEGQISTTEPYQGLSRVVEEGMLLFGRAVARGSKERSCKPVAADTTAEDIIGFSIRTAAEPSLSPINNDGNYIVGYPVDHDASVLESGAGMYVICVDGAQAGQTVGVIVADGEDQGRLTAGDASGVVELTALKWVDDVAAGELGEIRPHGIFSV